MDSTKPIVIVTTSKQDMDDADAKKLAKQLKQDTTRNYIFARVEVRNAIPHSPYIQIINKGRTSL